MKKKSTKLLVIALMLVLLMGLSACGGSGSTSQFQGSWKVSGVMVNDKVQSLEDAGVSVDMTLNIEDGGKVSGDMAGQKLAGEWTEKDDTVTITDDSGAEMKGTLNDDGQMIIEASGSKLVFDKSK